MNKNPTDWDRYLIDLHKKLSRRGYVKFAQHYKAGRLWLLEEF